MAKFILMQVVQVLFSVMVIFGSDQKKSGKNVFIIQCIGLSFVPRKTMIFFQNGSARGLRAALSRFGDLCHLIRPQKCR